MNKIFSNAAEAISDIKTGSSILMGGFGLTGVPENLISALILQGTNEITCISNEAGLADCGIGRLIAKRQIRKMVCSYIGENHLFEKFMLEGNLAVELVPQGTLAERIRCGGAGIPAFFTPAGVGTEVAEGKETREFDGKKYLMEKLI